MIYYLYNILRTLLYPLVRYCFPLFSKKARARVNFEHQNFTRRPSLDRAEFAFEISSEGELEQVFPLIETLIKDEKSIEIVYSSQSVDEKIKGLVKKYPNQIRAFILPIICYQPWSKNHNVKKWLTADHLFLCRYDFFPELIAFGRKSKSFTLVSATAKSLESKNPISGAYYKWCLKSFDKIVSVSQKEKDSITRLANISQSQIEVFDFRILQINNRLNRSESTLDENWPLWRDLHANLNNRQKTKVILGNFWNHEFELIKPLADKVSLVLVPHQLQESKMDILRSKLGTKKINFIEIKQDTTHIPSDFEGVFILNLKGILCELYSLFDIAYVGGGFGSSIHSALEPYLAGCRIVTGPRIHRSTEFDVISEYDSPSIRSLSKLNDIANYILNENITDTEHIQFSDHYRGHMPALLMWLGLSQGEY